MTHLRHFFSNVMSHFSILFLLFFSFFLLLRLLLFTFLISSNFLITFIPSTMGFRNLVFLEKIDSSGERTWHEIYFQIGGASELRSAAISAKNKAEKNTKDKNDHFRFETTCWMVLSAMEAKARELRYTDDVQIWKNSETPTPSTLWPCIERHIIVTFDDRSKEVTISKLLSCTETLLGEWVKCRSRDCDGHKVKGTKCYSCEERLQKKQNVHTSVRLFVNKIKAINLQS